MLPPDLARAGGGVAASASTGGDAVQPASGPAGPSQTRHARSASAPETAPPEAASPGKVVSGTAEEPAPEEQLSQAASSGPAAAEAQHSGAGERDRRGDPGALAAPGGAATPSPITATSPGLAFAVQAARDAPPSMPQASPHPVVEGVPISGVPVEIGLKSLGGIHRFDIRLAPEDLGGIDVRLDIAEDGRVSAHLLVDRRETMQWLQRDSGQLERALDQAGLRTADGGVSVTLRDPSGGDFGRQAGTPGDQGRGGAAPGRPDADPGLREAGASPDKRIWSRASGIDLRI
ncbi:flagellar hook-length control protein FliK [uncultured Enterovirga sp.]|uniref:flagellar hook-length control protein FliK n=1 Tax=uncultured Enterovirga sp. TaxID=2026352 RepID=UPI0035CA7D9A